MSVPVGSQQPRRRAAWRVIAALVTLTLAAFVGVSVAWPAVSAEPDISVEPISGLPGSTVVVNGSGWPRTDLCEMAWVADLPATQNCTFTDRGGLEGATLLVPLDALPGVRTIQVCMPDCEGPKNLATADFTVLAPRVPVPDLHGKGYPEAVVSLKTAGLRLAPGTTRPDDPTATVDTQDPVAGTEVDEGSPVSVSFVVPPIEDKVPVPNLVGLTRKQARAAMVPGDLVLAIDPAGDPKGKVQTQQPKAESLVDRGSLVSVRLLAVTDRLVAVPDVVGLKVRKARRLVEGLELILRVDETRKGTVGTQFPAPGTLVRKGTTVGVQLAAVIPPIDPDPDPDPGPSPWVLVAVAALAFLLGGVATTLGSRVRRRGPRWVHAKVAVRATDVEPSYDAFDDLPGHTVRLVHDPGESRTELIEVPR